MNIPTYGELRSIFSGKQMPFAYVNLDLLNANAEAIKRRADGKPVRVASKSIRIVSVLRHIFSLGSTFQGVMCYSANEAVHLSQHGFDDLLVAYPVWNERQIEAVCTELSTGKTIILMLDCVEHVKHLETIAARHQATLPVCLDIDLSLDLPGLHFGVYRSPVTTVESALAVYHAVAASPHLRFDGIMGYEAQIAGVGDKNVGLETPIVKLLKQRAIPHLRQRRKSIVDALEQHGAVCRIINGGGTGSLESTSQEDCVTEVTVGSGFYSPTLFDHYKDFQHYPAAGYAIEIVRQPKPGLYTCFGGGYVASGSAGAKLPKPYLPAGATLIRREAAGEVQTPIAFAGDEFISLGDPIFMRHAKAGELFEHFNTAYLVSDGKIIDEVATYRGEGCVFA